MLFHQNFTEDHNSGFYEKETLEKETYFHFEKETPCEKETLEKEIHFEKETPFEKVLS